LRLGEDVGELRRHVQVLHRRRRRTPGEVLAVERDIGGLALAAAQRRLERGAAGDRRA